MPSRHVKLLILGVTGSVACTACQPPPAPDTIVNHRLCEVGARSDAPAPIPVGCEIADASLGCAPNSALEVRIRFDAPEEFKLRLNLSDVEDPERIVASGEATRESPSVIVLGSGDSLLTGFSTSPARVPMMFPSVTVPPALLEPQAQVEETPINATIEISQWVGEYPVNRNVTTHSYYACATASSILSSTAEHVDVTGNTGGSNLVALIDGRRSSGSNGCKKLEHFYGASKILTGNVLENQGCPARLTVFSNVQAAEYLPDVAEWTNGGNDKVDVTLGSPVVEPVKIWMLYDECQDPDRPASTPCVPDKQKLKLLSALEVASDLYMYLYGGIRFGAQVEEPMESNDPTLVQNAKAAWSVEGCFNATNRASTLAEFAKVSGPDPGKALQVFFVKSARNGYGWWCGVNQPNGVDTIVIAMGHADLTLAHEIGHALLNQGVHAKAGAAGFTSANLGSNLMRWDLGDYLTLGQLSRASLSADSPVNRHQRRGPDATTDCPAASAVPVSDGACPELAFDVPR